MAVTLLIQQVIKDRAGNRWLYIIVLEAHDRPEIINSLKKSSEHQVLLPAVGINRVILLQSKCIESLWSPHSMKVLHLQFCGLNFC